MTSPTGNADEDEDAVRAFIAGQLRDELGLTSSDLSTGLEVAKSLMKRGAHADALKIYATLILCEPANVAFQIGLANCAIALGEHHLALQAASAVVALSPRDPHGYLLSGQACIGIGAFAEAAEDLNDAVKFGRDARNVLVVESARRLLQALPAGAAAATAAG